MPRVYCAGGGFVPGGCRLCGLATSMTGARLQSETCAVPAESGASLHVPVSLQRTHSQRRPAARVDPSASGQDGNGERAELATGCRQWRTPCQPNHQRPTICVTKVWALVTQTEGREGVMLTRRGFAGFASCAICGIMEFVATAASAQGAPPAASGGVTRKILSQTDGPMP